MGQQTICDFCRSVIVPHGMNCNLMEYRLSLDTRLCIRLEGSGHDEHICLPCAVAKLAEVLRGMLRARDEQPKVCNHKWFWAGIGSDGTGKCVDQCQYCGELRPSQLK